MDNAKNSKPINPKFCFNSHCTTFVKCCIFKRKKASKIKIKTKSTKNTFANPSSSQSSNDNNNNNITKITNSKTNEEDKNNGNKPSLLSLALAKYKEEKERENKENKERTENDDVNDDEKLIDNNQQERKINTELKSDENNRTKPFEQDSFLIATGGEHRAVVEYFCLSLHEAKFFKLLCLFCLSLREYKQHNHNHNDDSNRFKFGIRVMFANQL